MVTEKGNTNTLQHEVGKHREIWIGTAESLIAAGIVERHMLPGEPGRNKTCVTFGNLKGSRLFHYDADYVNIQRRGRYRYRVCKRVSKDEDGRRAALIAKPRQYPNGDAKNVIEITSAGRPLRLAPGNASPHCSDNVALFVPPHASAAKKVELLAFDLHLIEILLRDYDGWAMAC